MGFNFDLVTELDWLGDVYKKIVYVSSGTREYSSEEEKKFQIPAAVMMRKMTSEAFFFITMAISCNYFKGPRIQ